MKFIATVEIEVGEECVRNQYEIPSDQPVTPAQFEEYAQTELGWAKDSFDGFEIKELKSL